QMSEARKLQIELIDKLSKKTDELTDVQRRALVGSIGQAVQARANAGALKAAANAQADAIRDQVKAINDAAAAWAKYIG
ncbi:hypothetical protein, partial [Lactococcus petauri]|uniref:hypothetical protein n=1 Tax=Lactococcus petauri TaxID=1940789 RepID=UPI0021F24A0F